nr:hypothetical protein [Candidatus Bathyarchaeota archaeon]
MSVVSDIEAWRGVGEVEPYIETSLRLTTGDETRNTVVKGILKEANLYNLYLISGGPVSVDDEGILLSRAFKERTTIKPGDIIELDVPFLQKTVQILVTGFVDDRSGYGGFLPLGKIQEIFGLDDKVTGVMIKLSNSTYEKEVKERLYQNYPVLFVESTEETKKDWVA